MSKLQQLKQTTKQTVNEISTAAKAHVDLVKNQYTEYTTKHGDPLVRAKAAVRTPVVKTREQVVRLGKDVNVKTEQLANRVNERTGKVTGKVTIRTKEVAGQLTKQTEELSAKVLDRLPKKQTNGGAATKPAPKGDEVTKPAEKRTADAKETLSKAAEGAKKTPPPSGNRPKKSD